MERPPVLGRKNTGPSYTMKDWKRDVERHNEKVRAIGAATGKNVDKFLIE